MERNGVPSVVLVTQAFVQLAKVVSTGSRLPELHQHVLPHPLNPLPDERVQSITREHLTPMLAKLLAQPPS
ncbi:MAG: hypothetical protein ACKVQU_29750 [Burkholderiales bacterium]